MKQVKFILIFAMFLLALQVTFAETIVFNNPNNETLADAYVYSNDCVSTAGSGTTNYIRKSTDSGIIWSYVMFALNRSIFNSSKITIDKCNVTMTYNADGAANVVIYNGSVHQVFPNASWTESSVTGNANPCATSCLVLGDGSKCNLTAESTTTMKSNTQANFTWNVTKMVIKEMKANSTNISMVFLSSDPTTADYNVNMNSRDAVVSNDVRPTLWCNYSAVVLDTTPPEITLINSTSEGGLGYIIFEKDVSNNKQSGTIARTNDTTPTFFAKTSESATCCVIDLNRDLNWTDCFAGTTNLKTDGTTHTMTLNATNATGRVGLHNFSIGCTDDADNENLTSTSGKFLVNITDNVPPRVTLNFPTQDMVFKVGKNNTIIFNFSATDNIDRNFTALILIDGTQEYFNNTYLNGTNASFTKTISSGSHYWNVTTNDSFNNINSSSVNFTVQDIGINFTLNEPKNNTLYYSGTNTIFNFTVNFSDSIDKCFLNINLKQNESNKTLITNKVKYNLTTNLTNADYNWTIGCNTTENIQKNSSYFSLFVNSLPNVSFVAPTLANNSYTNNDSILINVSTIGKIEKYILDWNGTNESFTAINSTLNVLVNKTGLADLSTYTYQVYVNDTNGNQNRTERRTVKTTFLGVRVSVSVGTNFTFRGVLDRQEAFYGNQSLSWQGNNTAITLSELISKNFTLYNNGTVVNQGVNNISGNYTIDFINGKITITNISTYFNGTTSSLITNKLNFSYNYYTGSLYLRTLNLSCQGQNESIGCLNVSTFLSSFNMNLSLVFNITNDPKRTRIIDDFTSSVNWTSFLLRSNNTNNRTAANHSVTCIDLTILNQTSRIRYRFNNSLELDYLNSTNISNKLNFTFNCTSPNSVFRILNGSAKNISGFDNFNFSWKGDNTTNTFILNLIDEAGTKVSSSTLTLSNTQFNYTGFALGSSLKNISIINLSVSNASGTLTLNTFFLGKLYISNSTHNQSQYVTMKASCTNSYANSTVLVPNVLTNMCIVPNSTTTKFVWLWQDILAPFRGMRSTLNYNISRVN